MGNALKVHWFDRAVGAVLPKLGYKMALARWQFRQFVRNYDAARQDNLWINWVAQNQPGELQDVKARPIMIARCRDLERNSDTAGGIASAIRRNVIGKGLQLQSRVLFRDYGEMDETSIKKIEAYWRKFIRKENCEVQGKHSFRKICAMIQDRLTFDGEVFFIKIYDATGEFPFKLQMMEYDQLDMNQFQNGNTKNQIYSGIEVDEHGRPVAYWFRQVDPMGIREMQPIRVEAARVIHLAEITRSSQIHGIPRIAKSVSRIRDIDSYIEAERIKSRLAACFGMVIEADNSRMTPVFNSPTNSSYDGVEIAPGMVSRLNPGETIKVVAPNITTYVNDFTRLNVRMAGSGQGFSYEQVSRDYSQTNYSSARQGLLEDQKTFGVMQEEIIEDFCEVIFKAAIEAGVLSGALELRNFFENPDRYYEHKWIPPGWSWIDPQKEINAHALGIALGITTLEEVCASLGKDWAEVLRQRSREVQEAQRLGLVLSTEPPTIPKEGDEKNEEEKQNPQAE
jgi:phage portal protein, lambda family